MTVLERGVARRQRMGWVAAGLLALTFVPALAGARRVVELSGNPAVTPDNARFVASPVPVFIHIIGAVIFCVLGAFQFVPSLRRRPWHRLAGRLVLPAGLAVALSGIWMSVFYDEPADVGLALTVERLFFGGAMAACLVLAFVAIRAGRLASHRAMMIRAYAIGQGAGTQVFTHLPWVLLVGPVDKTSKAVLMLLGWLINLAVAEWAIRRPLRAVNAQ